MDVSELVTETDTLITYLATHDAPCPGCYRNIKGHDEPNCQACGQVLHLGEVLTAHAAFGDAKGAPVIATSDEHRMTLQEYLATHNAPCPGCTYNLRGLTDSTCPECGRSIRLFDLLPKQTGPGGTQHSIYPLLLSIAIPVIAIAFIPVITRVCQMIWDQFVLYDNADSLLSAGIACAVTAGVWCAIRHGRKAKKPTRTKNRTELERAQNIKIVLVLILFAVATVLICRRILYIVGGILGGAW